MERFKLRGKEEEEQPVIERVASEVKRMHASSNTLASKMRKTAEDTKRRAEERRKEAVREMQGRLAQYKKESEARVERFRENVRRRISHTWGTHKPGTRVTDIV